MIACAPGVLNKALQRRGTVGQFHPLAVEVGPVSAVTELDGATADRDSRRNVNGDSVTSAEPETYVKHAGRTLMRVFMSPSIPVFDTAVVRGMVSPTRGESTSAVRVKAYFLSVTAAACGDPAVSVAVRAAANAATHAPG